eukprot:352738-Chlamydomonas_euryale.AAC.5
MVQHVAGSHPHFTTRQPSLSTHSGCTALKLNPWVHHVAGMRVSCMCKRVLYPFEPVIVSEVKVRVRTGCGPNMCMHV